MSTDRPSAPTCRPLELLHPLKQQRREPDDFALGRSRGGFGTKRHLVADGRGIPLGATISAAQRHESVFFEQLMDTVRISRRRRTDLLSGDGVGKQGLQLSEESGVAASARHHERYPDAFNQAPQPFDREAYRGRNYVERCISWLKQCRRLATRYDKVAGSYLAFVKMAMIQRCLRLLDPPNRT